MAERYCSTCRATGEHYGGCPESGFGSLYDSEDRAASDIAARMTCSSCDGSGVGRVTTGRGIAADCPTCHGYGHLFNPKESTR